MYSRLENGSECKGSKFLLWMNYKTLARLKQLFSPALYIYWDTWKPVVINQTGFHIPHCTTWLVRFWASIAPCKVSPIIVTYKAANVKFNNGRSANNELWITSNQNSKEQKEMPLFSSSSSAVQHPYNHSLHAAASICSHLSRPFCEQPDQCFNVIYLVDEWRLYRVNFIMCPW